MENQSPFGCHQDSLAYLGVYDELLLSIAQFDRFLGHLGGILVVLQDAFLLKNHRLSPNASTMRLCHGFESSGNMTP